MSAHYARGKLVQTLRIADAEGKKRRILCNVRVNAFESESTSIQGSIPPRAAPVALPVLDGADPVPRTPVCPGQRPSGLSGADTATIAVTNNVGEQITARFAGEVLSSGKMEGTVTLDLTSILKVTETGRGPAKSKGEFDK